MWAVLIYVLLIIRYFIVKQYVIGSLGDIRQQKKQKNKTKPNKSHNPKLKSEL